MDRAIYTAMGAANAALNRQAVTSNNLANTSTPGFRAQLMAYRAVPVNGPSVETRTLVTESTPYHDSTMGMINHTGRDLDVALPQSGWLAVATADGSEAYTRAGNIEVDADGQLSVRGFALMGDGGPIAVPPQSEITIAPDGTISALGAGDEPSAMAQVGRIKLVNADIQSMRMGDDGLFYGNDGELAADLEMKLIPGAVESSNVSPVKSMVDMIAGARTFDMQMKVISTVDENARSANQLLTIS
ncbi:flagellar biosynthesis protein FlgF [Citrobacter amalonaticus]|uniref:Flagellar basal-body rod protein FlgF n=1 Tax=Citrobacter amalonaticus TaxID=35703 RepID=A0A2S4RRF2_CITAM|nr:flagellar basal body rod protein FlgF [Citrobacter amalonaticus]POT54747.1 flagellar biosynthesis protein FlgF [Citrobacter amalonaticus]POT69955.1 flagellar biosynthesis protein FlgF [Citrobacter amalonaticus]POU61214.1 flagellar biosynthesis protein FlgF [Citrobacter amalonaticus]POV02568.1 flagellar biosynthesis protein FlgF [Citrobacter amalonaticus]